MQPESALPFQPDLALWSLLTAGVYLGVCFVILTVVRRSTQATQGLAKLTAVIVAMVFAMIFVTKFVRTTISQPIPPMKEARLVAESMPPRVAPPSSGESLTLATSEAESTKLSSELPEWTRQTSRVEGANTFVVVKSGRFATLEEAELHAFDEAGQAAAQHFRNFDPSGIGQCGPMQRELVRESAIRDRFEEISRHDFGTMKNFPMHQVWLRVELNRQLGERFVEPWRQAAVAARLRTLTGWSVWSTAAAALIAFALRLDSAWNGRRRAVVVGATAALMLGSLAFLA